MAQLSAVGATSEEDEPLVRALQPLSRAGSHRRAIAAAAMAASAAAALLATRARDPHREAGAATVGAEQQSEEAGFLAVDRMALEIARGRGTIVADEEPDRALEGPAADVASTTPDFSLGAGDLPGSGSSALVASEPFMMLQGFGCQNYRSIAKGDPTTGEALETCSYTCAKTSGCVGFGFQESAQCDGVGTGHDGACYLWFEKCVPIKNGCWDQYGPIISDGNASLSAVAVTETEWLPNSTLEGAKSASVPYPVESGIGCANWEDILMGEPISGLTLENCSESCQRGAGCVGFGYQEHASCSGQGNENGGACHLYGGACDRIDNPCWDQYGEVSDAPIATTTTDLHHRGSLYCWTAFKQNTYEVGLIKNQFDRQMGVFNWECDGKAAVTDGEFYMDSGDGRTLKAINMGPGSLDCDRINGQSWANTGVFKRAWQTIIDQGEYTKYDWVIKVDADAVFRPLRFKWHVAPDHLGLNPDDRIYFKNFMWGYPVVGAIEVASRPVIEAMAQDPPGCNNMWMPAEDDWFHQCMAHHGARMVEDTALLQHENHPEGNRCADPWFVTLHPYKDVWQMNHCDEAIR